MGREAAQVLTPARAPARGSAAERFWSYTLESSGCWQWEGPRNADGYGWLRDADRGKVFAHRFAYELLVGPIPEGLTIDHLCRNRACVNPEHMEPVSAVVNVMRGISPPARHARATHCPKGHPYSETNTYVTPGRGWRQCRQCRRARKAQDYRNRKHRQEETI